MADTFFQDSPVLITPRQELRLLILKSFEISATCQVVFSELGRSWDVSHTTARNYLDTLTDFYMVRQLPPWSDNMKKRLVKSPKIYLWDSGLLHRLLNISDFDALLCWGIPFSEQVGKALWWKISSCTWTTGGNIIITAARVDPVFVWFDGSVTTTNKYA